ncbi:MAG TPA: nitrogen fixation protein NifB [Verrucomicrobia bacterium]|nr:MAG: nitrogen fixation protein NifB [Lentisphaerae bacterium GWF2_57_35]HBA82925.1 nitrogen fixation protein NifB [Verrucomicrobiota bacterium]
MKIDIAQHPCFNREARTQYARVHLPVAPACNVQCRFCDRKFDCVNESRPGVTSVVLTPGQALEYLRRVRERTPQLRVVGIAGPGDPFANTKETLETLRLVRENHPDLLLCVATNGLAIEPHIPTLIRLEVSHVTITVNAVHPEIGAKVYAWMRNGPRVMSGIQAAEMLWAKQSVAIRRLSDAGILVKINSIVIPGLNENELPLIAEQVKALGAQMMNCIPLYPAAGTDFGTLIPSSPETIARLRAEAGAHLPQMTHCARCRADACGLIGADTAPETARDLLAVAKRPRQPGEDRPHIAAVSREGLLVNQHLGEAEALHVFAPDGGAGRLVEIRPAPERGLADRRWESMSDLLRDCQTLLVSGIGPNPRRILEQRGLRVIEMEGLIDDALRELFAGRDMPATMRRRFEGCGHGCAGQGTGCG